MIARRLKQIIDNHKLNNKAIVIIGSRQVGKTTLLREMFPENDDCMWFFGDDLDTQQLFSNMTATRLRNIIGRHTTLVIDEAQRIQDIGLRMKLITDQMPDVKLIATGSSAFELSNQLNEPLTGRKWEYRMYPISFAEMVDHHGLQKELRMLPQRLVYGYYPEVVTSVGDEKEILKQLSDSYLYKDLLALGSIKKPEKLVLLLKALAYQVGSQVSYNELAGTIGLDAKTVETYIQLLEKSYVVFRLTGFSRNMRNELKNSKKIYFYDNGIRNALVSNFANVESRTDMGALWENFVISERMKRNEYGRVWCNSYFWRTKDQTEIDYLEEQDGKLMAYEFKYNSRRKAKLPPSFDQAYPRTEFKEITPYNIEEFLCGV
ncbi:MAG: ATP-binding protein [Bacteroidales bacterium]|nr:ATP-binding protein [Bacteroidales bacterium]